MIFNRRPLPIVVGPHGSIRLLRRDAAFSNGSELIT